MSRSLPPFQLYQHNCPGYDGQGFWVFFTDKDGVRFDPYHFFDEKAIERRLSLDICLYDTLDFPVRTNYKDSVAALTGSSVVVSRWLNAIHVYTDPDMAFYLADLPFVRKVRPASTRLLLAAAGTHAGAGKLSLQPADTALFHAQQRHLSAEHFTQNGYDGEGIRIAVFDAGFRGVNTHPAFRHLKSNGQIVDTWDFHRGRKNVYTSSAHGTMVLSAIAGVLPEGNLGVATRAEFLLARTEIFREPLAEEKYWLAAVEWADQKGADIINSSLGYVFHRYFPEEMDGQTSLVARAAHIAARKGILVINAAGNMGNNQQWRVIVTPADADSVLTVGALDFPSMLRADYSSVGPTADGRMKPNVSALGTVVAANRRRLATPTGTSFAAPLITGFAACLWQMYPSWTNMQLFRAIERSGSLYPYYDYAHGYGTPQASYFFEDQTRFVSPRFDIRQNNDSIKVLIREQITRYDGREQEKTTIDDYLYYHIKNRDGDIDTYFVVDLEGANKMRLSKENMKEGQTVLFHYMGYTAAVRIEGGL